MILIKLFVFMPLLSPFIAGALLGLIIRRPRSDMLALFVSLAFLLLRTLFETRFGLYHNVGFLIPSEMKLTTVNLILAVASDISLCLIFPFIFSRWGIELVDRIRRRYRPSDRRSSKGNAVLGTMVAIFFIASFAQTFSIMTDSFSEAQTEAARE